MAEANSFSPPPPTAERAGVGEEQKEYGTPNLLKKRRRREIRNKKVKELEQQLANYDRQIRRAMEAEVTLEDMDTDTSAYLMEDMLKRKFMKTWYKLCSILNIDPEVRSVQESGVYEGSKYPQLNRRVNRLLDMDEFPDHYDVCQMVERVNEKYSLLMDKEERVSLSRKVFKDVGKIIQRRRKIEFVDSFGSHLTDLTKDDQDPALNDEALKTQLDSSVAQGEKTMAELCEHFAVRQETEGDNTASEGESDDDSGEDLDKKTGTPDDSNEPGPSTTPALDSTLSTTATEDKSQSPQSHSSRHSRANSISLISDNESDVVIISD